MSKAIFTIKSGSGYDDRPEEYYHFPKTYLNQVQQAVGDHIIYYEPRRSAENVPSIGGRQSYFATARVTAVIEDKEREDHYYALIADYLDFDRAVPFAPGGIYFERALQRVDGKTNKGAFGRAVRLIADVEFDLILRSGFAAELMQAGPEELPIVGFQEEDTEFVRPVVELTITETKPSKRPCVWPMKIVVH